MSQIKQEKDEANRAIREKSKAKQERKKVNEMRSAKYQIIKNLSKTKKWHRKAKRTLCQLPAEIFYEKFKSTGPA